MSEQITCQYFSVLDELDAMDKEMESIEPFDVITIACPWCFSIEELMTVDEVVANNHGEVQKIACGALAYKNVNRRPFHLVLMGMKRPCQCLKPTPAGASSSPQPQI